MKTIALAVLVGLALAAGPSDASAQEQLRVALPESHDLVELQPGLQVIPDFDLEVFFTGNAYWLRTDGRWYQARRPAASATFTLAEPRAVPAALAKLPADSHVLYRPAPGQKRSTKVLASAEPVEREAEVEAGPATVAPRAAPAAAPAAKPAAARPAPAAAAPPKPAPAQSKKAPPAPAKPRR